MGQRWCAVPVLAGLVFVVLPFDEALLVACFGSPVVTYLALKAVIVLGGFLIMTSAIPTYYIARITRSEEFRTMFKVVCSRDVDFGVALVHEMDSILRDALLHGLLIAVVYVLLSLVAFHTRLSMIICSLVGGAASLMTRAQTLMLQSLVRLSNQDIDNFIEEVFPEVQEKGRRIDWHHAASAHFALDIRLEKLWSPACGAMLLGPLIASRCAIGGLLLVLGAVLDDPWTKIGSWIVGAGIMANGAHTLSKPALVTTRCLSTSPALERQGIMSTMHAIACNTVMSETEAVLHNKFSHYVAAVTTGVKLFGVLITPGFVATVSFRLLTLMPIAVGLLNAAIEGRRIQNSCSCT
mmetsp:Transcript_19103/g.38894  ORF Transcript_19103/g.38894 Transcript_19103/m.38894 type:complete len:352 (+) Transcript_19103:39-1094(+)